MNSISDNLQKLEFQVKCDFNGSLTEGTLPKRKSKYISNDTTLRSIKARFDLNRLSMAEFLLAHPIEFMVGS